LNNFFKKENIFNPEVTHGVCPTCNMPTMLISVTKDFYRCITCGSDLEQKINGVIKYIPTAVIQKEEKPEA
jgi:uncharacterized protein (DUF983 family)